MRRIWTILAGFLLLACVVLFAWSEMAVGEDDHAARQAPGYHYPVTAPLSGYDDPRVKRRPDEPALAFAERVTRAVHLASYHCLMDQGWPPGAQSAEAERAGLFSELGVLSLPHFTCGLCHQRAFFVADILDREGISAKVLGLNGHVVAFFSHDGQDYVADPDLGVMPFSVPYLRSNGYWLVDLWSALELYRQVSSAYAYLDTFYGNKFYSMVVWFFLSTDDNVEYYNMRHLREIASRQAAALSRHADSL